VYADAESFILNGSVPPLKQPHDVGGADDRTTAAAPAEEGQSEAGVKEQALGGQSDAAAEGDDNKQEQGTQVRAKEAPADKQSAKKREAYWRLDVPGWSSALSDPCGTLRYHTEPCTCVTLEADLPE
jgi:hypothetical protein